VLGTVLPESWLPLQDSREFLTNPRRFSPPPAGDGDVATGAREVVERSLAKMVRSLIAVRQKWLDLGRQTELELEGKELKKRAEW
jgi:hypothetical protein